MADGRVKIEVILSDDDVKKGVSDVNKSLGGLQGSAEKSSVSIGKIASALGLVYAAKKGIDLLRDSLHGAFKRIDTMEQFERVMGVMVDDTDAVSASLSDLESIVEGTAMRMDVMTGAVQGFVTRGIEIEDATNYVEAWGNAVAFYGDGSNEQFANVTDALHNMVSKGTVGMDQLNRITEAGIPAVELYADATGKSADEVSAALSNGEISAEQFVETVSEAMMEGTEKFPEISSAMEDEGASWGSIMENVGAYVQLGMTDIVQAIDDMLENNGLPDMRTMIDNFGRSFGETLSNIAEKIPEVVGAIQEWWQSMEPIQPLLIAIGKAVGIVVGAIATFGTVVTIINTVRKAIQLLNMTALMNPWTALAMAAVAAVLLIIEYWEPISEFFINLWEGIKEAGLAIWEMLKEAWTSSVEFLSELWEGIAEFFSEIWETISEIFMEIWEPIQEAWQEVVEFFTEIWADLVEFFTELWADIKETMLEVWEPIKETWNEVVEFFSELWDSVVEVVTEVWNTIVDTIVEAWNSIVEFVTPVVETIKFIIETAWKGIKSVIETVMDIISSLIEAAWEGIKTVIDTVLNIIKNIIETAWNVIKTVIETVVEIIKTVIETTWNVIKGVIETVMNLIEDDISGAWNGIKSIIESVVNGIKSVITSVWNGIKGIISSVMSGISSTISSIWNGIKSIVSSVVNSIKSTISNIFNSLKGIVSGAMSGVRNAVSNGIKGALNAVTDMATSFFDAGKNIVTSIIDGIKAAPEKITDAIKDMAGAARDFLPFSPAKRGPFKDLDKLDFGVIGDSVEKSESKVLDSMRSLMEKASGELNTDVELLGSLRGQTPNNFIGGLSFESPVTTSEASTTSSSSSDAKDAVYEFNIDVPLDGKTIAKKTVRFTAEELEGLKRRERRKRG